MTLIGLDLGFAPRYHQVRVNLLRRIEAGEWQLGDKIPTEPELMHQFGVSRGTLRQAMDALVRQGLLQREPGRGTFVRRPPVAVGVAGFFHVLENLQRQGHQVDPRVISRGTVAATGSVAELLDLPEGTLLVAIRRLILLDGEPFRLDDYFAPHDRFAGMLHENLDQGYLYNLVQRRYGVRLTRQQKWFEPVLASDDIASLLAVGPHDPVLRIEGVSFGVLGDAAGDERLVDFRRLHMRGDKCRLFVETVQS